MRKLQTILILTLISGCIESFNPELPVGFENRTLVVDGRITNQAGPYTVKLSSSSPIGLDTLIVETSATVRIEEENGPSTSLVEVRPGVYMTDPSQFVGEVGKRYRLLITLFDELEYASSWELMKATPEIQALHYQAEVNESQRGTQFGVTLSVDTQGDENSSFFRWEIEETWKYTVPLVSDSVYLGNNIVRLKTPAEFNQVCWKRSQVSNLMLTSVSDLSENTISNFPLTFISSDSARFDERYSANVKQYSLGIDEYNFWKSLENTTENVGSLFDKQPFQVVGNVKNIRNEDAPVLGYFSANAESQARIFIDRSDFNRGFLPDSEFVDCQISVFTRDTASEQPESFEQFDQRIQDLISNGLRVFYQHPSMDVFNLTTPVCGDCEVYGGTTVQPDFWIE